MSATEIIAAVVSMGGAIELGEGDRLLITPPPGGMPPEMLGRVRRQKPGLVDALRMVCNDAPQSAPHVAELVAVCEQAMQAPSTERPGIDPAKRRDVIGEQPNPPAYVAWLRAED